MDNWVSVKDKLPQKKVWGKEVLVCRKMEWGIRNNKMTFRRFVTIENFRNGIFHSEYVNNQVTHWQPLPELQAHIKKQHPELVRSLTNS